MRHADFQANFLADYYLGSASGATANWIEQEKQWPETELNRRRGPFQGVNKLYLQLLTRLRGLPKYSEMRVTLGAVPRALRPPVPPHPGPMYSVAHEESVKKKTRVEFSGIRFALRCQPPRFYKGFFSGRWCDRIGCTNAFARPKSKQQVEHRLHRNRWQ